MDSLPSITDDDSSRRVRCNSDSGLLLVVLVAVVTGRVTVGAALVAALTNNDGCACFNNPGIDCDPCIPGPLLLLLPTCVRGLEMKQQQQPSKNNKKRIRRILPIILPVVRHLRRTCPCRRSVRRSIPWPILPLAELLPALLPAAIPLLI